MKKFSKSIIVLILASFLVGCYPSEPKIDPIVDTESRGSNSEQNIGGDSHINLQTDNLIADIEFPTGIPSELPQIKLTLRKWDKEFMEKTLLDGKKIVEQWDGECQVYPGEKLYGYDTEDQIRVYFEPGRFGYDDKEALGGEYKYGSVYSLAYDDFTANDDELSAFSRENAVTRVNEFLDRLEITNYGEPRITPITADFAESVLSEYKERGEKIGKPFDYTPWTANEEVYFLHYPLIYGTAELCDEPISIPQKEWATFGSRIDAVVSKDKIISVTGWDIFEEEYEEVSKTYVNFSASQAFEKLKDHYFNLVVDKPVNYYKCKLAYIANDISDDLMTMSFTPAWEYFGYADQPDSRLGKSQYIDYYYVDTGFRYIMH